MGGTEAVGIRWTKAERRMDRTGRGKYARTLCLASVSPQRTRIAAQAMYGESAVRRAGCSTAGMSGFFAGNVTNSGHALDDPRKVFAIRQALTHGHVAAVGSRLHDASRRPRDAGAEPRFLPGRPDSLLLLTSKPTQMETRVFKLIGMDPDRDDSKILTTPFRPRPQSCMTDTIFPVSEVPSIPREDRQL